MQQRVWGLGFGLAYLINKRNDRVYVAREVLARGIIYIQSLVLKGLGEEILCRNRRAVDNVRDPNRLAQAGSERAGAQAMHAACAMPAIQG
jgi:hypothetical protein